MSSSYTSGGEFRILELHLPSKQGGSQLKKRAWRLIRVNSRCKKVHFSFLKSRVVWFKKDLCSESKNRSSEKNALCWCICNLRSYLNRKLTVLLKTLIYLSQIYWWTIVLRLSVMWPAHSTYGVPDQPGRSF